MAKLKTMPIEEKRAFGPQVQELQQIITQELYAHQQKLLAQALNKSLKNRKFRCNRPYAKQLRKTKRIATPVYPSY